MVLVEKIWIILKLLLLPIDLSQVPGCLKCFWTFIFTIFVTQSEVTWEQTQSHYVFQLFYIQKSHNGNNCGNRSNCNERLYVTISLTTSFVIYCSDVVAVPLLFDREHLFQRTKIIKGRPGSEKGEALENHKCLDTGNDRPLIDLSHLLFLCTTWWQNKQICHIHFTQNDQWNIDCRCTQSMCKMMSEERGRERERESHGRWWGRAPEAKSNAIPWDQDT